MEGYRPIQMEDTIPLKDKAGEIAPVTITWTSGLVFPKTRNSLDISQCSVETKRRLLGNKYIDID